MDDPGFWEWVKTPRSQGGGGLKSGDPIATEAAYNTLMREYLKSGGGGFQPTAIAVTNPVNTNQVIPVLTTSPNSVQPLPQTQFKPSIGKDGKAYNYNPVTGTYSPALIEGTTNQFEADPKSNRAEDLVNALNDFRNQDAAEESPGFFSRIFGGVPATNAPTPTPTPMPTPEMQRTAGPAVPTGTNAMAPVAAPTPAVFSAAEFKRMSGQDLPPGDYMDANGRPFTVR